MVDDFADDVVDIRYFGEFVGSPVVEECSAFLHDEQIHASAAGVRFVMECARVQPVPVKCSTQSIALFCGQESPVLEIVLPLLERVDVAPLLRHSACLYNLFEESDGEGYRACYVRWLAGVVCEELRYIVQRAVLILGRCFQQRQLP